MDRASYIACAKLSGGITGGGQQPGSTNRVITRVGSQSTFNHRMRMAIEAASPTKTLNEAVEAPHPQLMNKRIWSSEITVSPTKKSAPHNKKTPRRYNTKTPSSQNRRNNQRRGTGGPGAPLRLD